MSGTPLAAGEGSGRRVLCPSFARAGLVTLALFALSLSSCSRKRAAAGSDEDEGPKSSESATAEVTVTRVRRAPISQSLAVTGTIAALPNQDVRVSSLVAGRIVAMMVAEGDRVSEGQLLAKIDDRTYHDMAQQAESAVDQAKASLENARLNRERNENLFKRGIAARKDLEDARTQEVVVTAALSQSEAALALAKLQLARTEVTSPLAGTVVKRLASVGEQVDGTAAQPLFEVANPGQVELFGNVPAVYLGQVRVRQPLAIKTEAYPDKEFQGRVVAISPAVDPSTNVGLVRIRIANEAGLLRLGMFLSAEIPLVTHSNALVVPPQAVYRDERGQPRIYRVQGETAEAVPVKLGLEMKDQVEVLTGVEEGETVILTGGYGLGDKAKIKIKS
jgi:membrane fusion protein, multidrug efflux system